MSAAVARWATNEDHDLIDGYARFCHDIGVGDAALRERLRLARLFLALLGSSALDVDLGF